MDGADGRLERLERAGADESPIPPPEQALAVLRMLGTRALLPEPAQVGAARRQAERGESRPQPPPP